MVRIQAKFGNRISSRVELRVVARQAGIRITESNRSQTSRVKHRKQIRSQEVTGTGMSCRSDSENTVLLRCLNRAACCQSLKSVCTINP